MLEFALLAPAMIMLFMGILEIGRFTTYAILAQASARSGAGYGAANLITAADIAGIQSATTNDAQYLPTPIAITAKHLCSVNGALPPTPCNFSTMTAPTNTVYYIGVTVNANYAPWVSYPGIPNPVTVSGSSYMRVSQQ